jgi:predicted metal-dependent phosphoesterase TrpH
MPATPSTRPAPIDWTCQGLHYRFDLSDLQVHTIADKHHSYGDWHGKGDAFASKLIEAHVEQGVEVIAVTDHLTIEWWRSMYRAGQCQGVHVFPEMEISSY